MSYANTLSFLEMSMGCSKWCYDLFTKKQKKITTDKFIKYFQNIENIQQWLTADDSEIEILNEDDILYIVEQIFLEGEKIKNLY